MTKTFTHSTLADFARANAASGTGTALDALKAGRLLLGPGGLHGGLLSAEEAANTDPAAVRVVYPLGRGFAETVVQWARRVLELKGVQVGGKTRDFLDPAARWCCEQLACGVLPTKTEAVDALYAAADPDDGSVPYAVNLAAFEVYSAAETACAFLGLSVETAEGVEAALEVYMAYAESAYQHKDAIRDAKQRKEWARELAAKGGPIHYALRCACDLVSLSWSRKTDDRGKVTCPKCRAEVVEKLAPAYLSVFENPEGGWSWAVLSFEELCARDRGRPLAPPKLGGAIASALKWIEEFDRAHKSAKGERAPSKELLDALFAQAPEFAGRPLTWETWLAGWVAPLDALPGAEARPASKSEEEADLREVLGEKLSAAWLDAK